MNRRVAATVDKHWMVAVRMYAPKQRCKGYVCCNPAAAISEAKAYLQNLRHALQAHAGVDVAAGQRGDGAVRRAVALHEHQVVELDEPARALVLSECCSRPPSTQTLKMPHCKRLRAFDIIDRFMSSSRPDT